MNAALRRWAALAAGLAMLGGCGDRALEVTPAPVVAKLDDIEYLYRLGLMRGHLLVGNALVAGGERAAARMHSKHPSDELYAPMAAELAARGVAGFAEELEAHARAVDTESDATVADRYAALVAAIGASEQAVEASPELAVRVTVRLVREAAREYAVGVVDGKLANAHEYQDAYGFTQVALIWSRSGATGATDEQRPVFERIADRLEALDDLWPTPMPPPELEGTAQRLEDAAADIETLAGGLRSRLVRY